MELLAVKALPALDFRHWDHVYVLSSRGHRWPCFGRDAAGVTIIAGAADLARSAFLAGEDRSAGIRFKATGVCHQAANRILYPAGLTVFGAHGYFLSQLAYGPYGLGDWPERRGLAGELPALPETAPLGPDEAIPADMLVPDRVRTYNRTVAELQELDRPDERARLELEAILTAVFDDAPEQRLLELLYRQQSRLREEVVTLGARAAANQLTQAELLTIARVVLGRLLDELRQDLRDGELDRLFGGALDQPEGLFRDETAPVA